MFLSMVLYKLFHVFAYGAICSFPIIFVAHKTSGVLHHYQAGKYCFPV
jgi:hypothetical protein